MIRRFDPLPVTAPPQAGDVDLARLGAESRDERRRPPEASGPKAGAQADIAAAESRFGGRRSALAIAGT